MIHRLTLIALSSLTLLAQGVSAQVPAPHMAGYLGPDRVPDMVKLLAGAPEDDSPTRLADRAIFRSTRALKGSPRWLMARNDADASIEAMMKDFSCAVGANLAPSNSPRLQAVLAKVGLDLRAAVDPPKAFYDRKRPFQVDEGDVCIDDIKALAGSPDYPSGHATWGWMVGSILAQLDPDRATGILVRAKAYGESRVVCGVHNNSAVIAGRLDAAALFAVLQSDANFRADTVAARAELTPLVAAGGLDVERCESEASVTAKTPW